MATNQILDHFATEGGFTLTLASLASSPTGAGQQSTIVDNTTNKYLDVLIYLKIKQGTSPTGNRAVYVYLIRDDNNGTNHRSDGAGASNAALTIQNAQLIGVMANKASPATGDLLYGEFLVNRPGPKWGIAVVHDTGVNLDSMEANHWYRWIGLTPDIQAAA